ncbi:hypothetical protein BH10ACI2_BH10ACI2_11080 [soil metagenome]
MSFALLNSFNVSKTCDACFPLPNGAETQLYLNYLWDVLSFKDIYVNILTIKPKNRLE